MRPYGTKKGVHIDVDIALETGDAMLDRKKFKQILDNLLSNAIKFNHDGGKVEVSAKLHDTEHVELVVNDNGIGIKAEDLGKLFKEFAQLDSGTTRRHEGTGLGLALTRKIVELQCGTIGVESEFGRGSTFTVVMPIENGRSKQIFIVDDKSFITCRSRYRRK